MDQVLTLVQVDLLVGQGDHLVGQGDHLVEDQVILEERDLQAASRTPSYFS